MSRVTEGGSSRHDLIVDLDELVSIGQVLLPALADDYATLNHMAADTGQQAAPLLGWQPGSGNETMHGGSLSDTDPIGSPWSALCRTLQNALGHSATNLQAAASALLAIEAHYQAVDHVSTTELNSAWDNEIWPQDAGYQRSYPPVQVTTTDE